MNVQINVINEIGGYLDALVKTDHVFEALKNRYPQVLADIVSSRENPNCGCRNRLANFLITQYNQNEVERKFIDEILMDQEVSSRIQVIRNNIFQQTPQNSIPQQESVNQINSKKFTIDKRNSSWDSFSEWIKSKNIDYKSFSVVDRGNELDVYFL